jgi:beta-lactamase class D
MNKIFRTIALILIVLSCITTVLIQPSQSALTAPTPAQQFGDRGGNIAQITNFGRHFQEFMT